MGNSEIETVILEPRYCQIIAERMHKLDPSLTIKRNGEPMQFNQLPF